MPAIWSFLFGPKLGELVKALKEEAQFGGQNTFKRKFSSKPYHRGNREFGASFKTNKQFSGTKSS